MYNDLYHTIKTTPTFLANKTDHIKSQVLYNIMLSFDSITCFVCYNLSTIQRLNLLIYIDKSVLLMTLL